MTVAVTCLTVLLLAILWYGARQADQWAVERRSLLDRIQFPEARQVQAGEMTVHEPPQDAGQLAMVGMIYDGGSEDAKPD